MKQLIAPRVALQKNAISSPLFLLKISYQSELCAYIAEQQDLP
jgi:hypothetical protein